MKKIYKKILIYFYVVIICIITGCVSTSSSNTGSSGPRFIGSGGSEMRLGILVPQSQGLNENQAYLPSMVQGILVSNMSKYSAISVLDRVSLDRVITETLDPTYEDNLDIVRLGHVTQVGYIMTGNILRTSTGYSLQINVTDTTSDAKTIASYSGNFSTVEIDNHTAINRASLDILSQMGIQLTKTARNELDRASSRQSINAETALAHGVVAQQSGNEFQAMINYFEARTFNVNIPEASTRITTASTTLAANNWNNTSSTINNRSNASSTSNDNNINTGARDSVLSQIEQMKEDDRLRREQELRRIEQEKEAELEAKRLEKERVDNIKALLKKATEFYKLHQPFTISMDNVFTYSNINHVKGTVDIDVFMKINPIESEIKIINDLTAQARSIGSDNWPYNVVMSGAEKAIYSILGLGSGYLMVIPHVVHLSKFNSLKGIWKAHREMESGEFVGYSSIEPDFRVEAEIINEKGKILTRKTFHFRDTSNVGASFSSSFKETFTITANDLTDTLTMRIVRINRKSVDNIRDNGWVGFQESVKLTGVSR